MVAGLRLVSELKVSVGSALKVPDLVRDAGSFDMMAAGLEPLFSQDELGMYLIELCIKLTLDVVKVLVLLNLSDVSLAVELGHS